MKLKENIKKYKQRGLIPSMSKGNYRWRLTYANGRQEIFKSKSKVNAELEKGVVIKLEKKRVVVELQGDTKNDFVECDASEWRDVTGYYL